MFIAFYTRYVGGSNLKSRNTEASIFNIKGKKL